MQDTTTVASSFAKPDSWHNERAKGIGGSEVAAILGISPFTTAYQLWLDKTGKTPRKEISHLPHVQRGILGELVCRDLLEREQLKSYTPKNWQGEKAWHRCSDDGWNIDTNTLLEIKCMSALNHEMVKAGHVPEYYACQCQWNLFVSKAEKCLFISFRPEDETMNIVEILPDPKEQKRIEAAVDYFWLTNIKQDMPPALTDKDYVKVANKDLDEKLSRYQELKKQIAILEGEAEAIKEDTRQYVSGHPAIQTPQGFRISVGSRKGSVDHERLYKDKAITPEEIEKYRKKPVEVYTIRLSSAEK